MKSQLKKGGMESWELDSLYFFIDDCFNQKYFGLVDAILEYVSVHITDLTSDHIIAYLTVTYPAKSKLPHRDNVYIKAKRLFTEEELKGLET